MAGYRHDERQYHDDPQADPAGILRSGYRKLQHELWPAADVPSGPGRDADGADNILDGADSTLRGAICRCGGAGRRWWCTAVGRYGPGRHARPAVGPRELARGDNCSDGGGPVGQRRPPRGANVERDAQRCANGEWCWWPRPPRHGLLCPLRVPARCHATPANRRIAELPLAASKQERQTASPISESGCEGEPVSLMKEVSFE